jgi:hypothetical protein
VLLGRNRLQPRPFGDIAGDFEAPMTMPSWSMIGDTLSEISTSRPSLRRRRVS